MRPRKPWFSPVLAAALCLLAGAHRPTTAEEPASHCPFHEANLEESGMNPQALRRGPGGEGPHGLRFTHVSALAPETAPAPYIKPHQETRKDSSAFHTWEFIQLGIILASAVAVIWLAHRKLED